jgi:hypothetical protein
MERQDLAAKQTATLVELMDQNTRLTELTNELSKRIESLTAEMHARVVAHSQAGSPPGQPITPGTS